MHTTMDLLRPTLSIASDSRRPSSHSFSAIIERRGDGCRVTEEGGMRGRKTESIDEVGV